MTRLIFSYGSILRNTVLTLLILLCFFPSIIYPQMVSPRISITSSQDPAGVKINIKGTSFSSGSMATLYAKNPDGSQAAVQNMNISKDGTFHADHLFPTGYLPGTYHLWVNDNATGRYSNIVEVNVSSAQKAEAEIPPQPYMAKHGDLVRATGDAKIYLVQNGQRRCFANEEVFRQMGFKRNDIKDIDPQDMTNIPEGPPIWAKEIIASFPEGTLIRLRGKTQTYVIQGGRKCYIPDPETFQSRGYSWDQVKEVDQATLDSIFTGIPIQSVKPSFQYIPPGQQQAVQPQPSGPPPMIQTQPPSSPTPSQPYGSSSTPPATGPTPSRSQPAYPPPMSSNPSQQQQTSPYGGSSIAPPTGFTQPQPQPQLQSQPPATFSNGTLVKGSGQDIYLIENGTRRLIPNMETFNAMGFNSNNVINVDNQKLGTVPMGVPLSKIKKIK